MARPYNERLIMMVAQQLFESDMNAFCKLIPIAYLDGTRALAEDFPNDGEIWWMLTARTKLLATPGRIVTGYVEEAVAYEPDKPDKSRYQAKRDSIQDLSRKEGFEVICLDADDINDIQDLVSSGFLLEDTGRPCQTALLRWRSQVFGPFVVSHDSPGSTHDTQNYRLSPESAEDMTVYVIDEGVFDNETVNFRIETDDMVSFTDSDRMHSYERKKIRHEILLYEGFQRLLASNPKKIALEPIDHKLLRLARKFAGRKKRQELRALLSDLEVTGSEADNPAEILDAVGRIRRVTEEVDSSLDKVAEGLLESGFLGEDRIAEAEKAFAEQYVQRRVAELEAKAEMSVKNKREELRRVEGELKVVTAKLRREETQARKEMHEQIAEERAGAQQRIESERAEFEDQKRELERQRTVLQQNLEKVISDLRDKGDDVVNRFLTIAPLLGTFGLTAAVPDGRALSIPTKEEKQTKRVNFSLPHYLREGTGDREDCLSEEVFLARYYQIVEESGFVYRPIDLQRFHISVKCGDMTVLGGPSGTGKSSLPMLYAHALAGEDVADGRECCLMVNVNPSWIDIRDLLGHMNTLEGRYYPAESGLFEYLVYAQEEQKLRGNMSGVYLACLDEMNLAQVEFYFSDFMMVLERDEQQRKIRCFSSSDSNNCPYEDWAQIRISPAFRFVGTVNFDETTRLLSDRFLDRVNLIQLPSENLPAAVGSAGAPIMAQGLGATAADLEGWCSQEALPAELAAILDQMRPSLNKMKCPISPRAYRSMCRFVSSAKGILSPAKAFDVQLAQRVVPKIRSLVTRRQLDALDDLMLLLNQSGACPFDDSLSMLEDVKEAVGTPAWDLED